MFSFLVESLILVLPVVGVGVVFGYLIKKGGMKKLTGREYPTEEAVFGKSEAPAGKLPEKDLVFKTDLISFIGVQIMLLVFIVLFPVIPFISKGDTEMIRLIGYPFIYLLSLALLLFFIQGIFTCVAQIRIIQKGVEFKKFFPSKIITLYPENVEKIIIAIGKDAYRTVGSFTFYLKDGKIYYFSIPYYTPEAIKNVLSTFSNSKQIKENAGIFRVIYFLFKSKFNL